MLSGPCAEYGFSLSRVSLTLAGENVMFLSSVLQGRGSGTGIFTVSSLVKTELKNLLSRVAMSLLSVTRLLPSLRGPIEHLVLVFFLI